MARRSLMAIGAHADDIEFNAAGTLLKYQQRGYSSVYVMSTNNMSGTWKYPRPDGGFERKSEPPEVMRPQRQREADQAARQSFGTKAIHLDHPQRHYANDRGEQLDICFGAARPASVEQDRPTILTAHEHDEHVQQLAALILEHQPEAVMTHGPVMVDMEHVGTCLLVSKAFARAAEAGYDGMLLHWPDITRALPQQLFGDAWNQWNTFVDCGGFWEEKIASIGHHASVVPTPQEAEFPQWGAACGCDHVEPFYVAHWGAQPQYDAALALELVSNRR